ncbi:MAG: ATPase [Oscillospiraceae bacterium]|jgi:sugar (pentulose or hexulose) kinase|nr:ATPase [Oscillospiraceae bacterium]
MKTFLGIELGSTRIKAVLIDQTGNPLASGNFEWENRFENNVWTYHLDDVWLGLQASYKELVCDYEKTKSKPMPDISGIGISAMMHGYLPLDKNGNQLTEFYTWRNTITEKESNKLTETFNFRIPQRWSIAHLLRTVQGKEKHVENIDFLTTLAVYVHYKLTGKKVAGLGEASGMFPIDSQTGYYHAKMIEKFENLIAEFNLPWKLAEILPKVLKAGEDAGSLTEEGAKLLDPTGKLKSGIPFCPPEGDAATGMVATNTVAPKTGNISAGTSIFAMLVLDKPLSKLYKDVDIAASPTGKPAALVHCNNCTSDVDAWVSLFGEVLIQMNVSTDKTLLYKTLYNAALNGETDCGGLVSINYISGEYRTGFSEGRPLFARTPDSKFTLENFMRSLLLSSIATFSIGIKPLLEEEGLNFSKLLGHGGLFKTPIVGQKLMAGALNLPIAVMSSAAEGGAWGIALLAAYSTAREPDETLEEFLENKIFKNVKVTIINPDQNDVDGFEKYLKRYYSALEIERTAVDML